MAKKKKGSRKTVVQKIDLLIEQEEEKLLNSNKYGQEYYTALDRIERFTDIRSKIEKAESDDVIHKDVIFLASISILESIILLFGTDIGMKLINRTAEMRVFKANNLLSKVVRF